MNCYLYGFIEAKEWKNFGEIGFELENKAKGTVVALAGDQNIGAVIGKTQLGNFKSQSREDLIQLLLSHQETLETIMKSQFILPCKFGTVLKNEEEVLEILSQNETMLVKWLDKMKDRCEMEVVATWDLTQTLRDIAENDPVTQELAKQEEEKLSLGVRLSEKLKEQASNYAEDILNALKEKSESYATHDVMNDTMVFNASFLLTRAGEGSLFTSIEALDQSLQGKLNFKLIGPLPPYSFATIQVKRFVPEEILKAGQTLGLNGAANLKGVKQAYKLKAQQCHPDTHPEFSQKEFETIYQAYKMLTDYYQGDAKPIQLFLLDASKELR